MTRLEPRLRRIRVPVRALFRRTAPGDRHRPRCHFNARILIMDEPTAALGVEETRMVAGLIRA